MVSSSSSSVSSRETLRPQNGRERLCRSASVAELRFVGSTFVGSTWRCSSSKRRRPLGAVRGRTLVCAYTFATPPTREPCALLLGDSDPRHRKSRTSRVSQLPQNQRAFAASAAISFAARSRPKVVSAACSARASPTPDSVTAESTWQRMSPVQASTRMRRPRASNQTR